MAFVWGYSFTVNRPCGKSIEKLAAFLKVALVQNDDEIAEIAAMDNAQETELPRTRRARAKGDWDDTIRTLLIALFIALVFRSFLFEPFHIPSGSMKRNLLVGDYLFVSKYSYGYSRYSFPLGLIPFDGRVGSGARPERGDVVVFRLPANPRIDYIKRVVGVPGDTVQVRNGILYINGEALPRKRIGAFKNSGEDGEPTYEIPVFLETFPGGKTVTILQETIRGEMNNTQVFRVPEKHYFMMGDNRDHSADSRYPNGGVGYVPEANIVGKARVIVFSTDGTAKFWEVWKWPASLRPERFFRLIE